MEEEVKVIREHPDHKHSLILFLGHDGLGDMRVMHMLARKYMVYLWTAPAVIPILGEYPHGAFHILHMGIRNYKQLVLYLLRATNHTSCLTSTRELKEPTVKDMRQWENAVLICVRAVAEWLLEASQDGTTFHMFYIFQNQILQNFDTALLFEFLTDFGFLYWRFKQSVRTNNAAKLKLLWRESLLHMRTVEANKTQYAPMAIENTYWDESLVEVLQQIKDENRTLSLNGNESCNVGWDYFPEDLNHHVRQSIHPPVDFAQVEQIAQDSNLLSVTSKGLNKVVKGHYRERNNIWRKTVQDQVDHLKGLLGAQVGHDWASLTAPRHNSRIGWVGARPRTKALEIARGAGPRKEAQDEFIRRHLADKITWH